MVFDRFDHHRMLQVGDTNLHAARAADARVRDVAIPSDLVAGVDDDDALAQVVSQHTGALSQHRRLAHARPAQQQDRSPAHDKVADQLDGAGNRASHPAGQADDVALAVADGGDAMQGMADAGAIVLGERAHPRGDVLQISTCHRPSTEQDFGVGKARLRLAAEVHDDLQQIGMSAELAGSVADPRWQRAEQQVELLGPAFRPRPRLLRRRLLHSRQIAHPNAGVIAFSFLARAGAFSLTRISRTISSWPVRTSKRASCNTRWVAVS